jgi:hypothetical protein
MEAEDTVSKEGHLPSAARDTNADPEDGDPDDDELDAVEDLEEHPCSVNQQTAIARAASRIALYMMREEFGDPVLGEKQHAHDFFVVNSCKVYCKVNMPASSGIYINDMSEVENTISTNNANNQGHLKVDVNQSKKKVSSGERCEGSQSVCIIEECDKPVFSGQAVYFKEEVCSSKEQADTASRNQSEIRSPGSRSLKSGTVEAMGTNKTNQNKWETVRDSKADQVGQHVSDQSHCSESETKHTDRDASPCKVLDALMPITHKDALKVLEEINQ